MPPSLAMASRASARGSSRSASTPSAWPSRSATAALLRRADGHGAQGGHRAYTQAHLDRLAFIRHARELGFPLDDVRALLCLSDDPDRPCADAIARQHLGAVRSRIARLQALEAELPRMVDACGHGKVGACRVIQMLADHSHEHCIHPGHGSTGL